MVNNNRGKMIQEDHPDVVFFMKKYDGSDRCY